MPPESSGRTCGQFGTRPFGSRQFANRQFGIVAPAGETGPNRFEKEGPVDGSSRPAERRARAPFFFKKTTFHSSFRQKWYMIMIDAGGKTK